MVSLTKVRVAVSPGKNKSKTTVQNTHSLDTAPKRACNEELTNGYERNETAQTASKKRRISSEDGSGDNESASCKRPRTNVEPVGDFVNQSETQMQKSKQTVAANSRSSSDDKQNENATVIRSPARSMNNDNDIKAPDTTPIKHPISMFIADCTQKMASKIMRSDIIDLTGAPSQLPPHRSFAPSSNTTSNDVTSNNASSTSNSNSVVRFAKGGNNKWYSKILIKGRTYFRQYTSEEEAAIDHALASHKFDVKTLADCIPTFQSNVANNRNRSEGATEFHFGSHNKAMTEVGAQQKMFGVLVHYNYEQAGGVNSGHLVTRNNDQSNASCLGAKISQPTSVPNPLFPQRKQDEHQLEHRTQKSNIKSLLSSICESISYDIVEVWFHHNEESYHLIDSYVSPKLDDSVSLNVNRVYASYVAGSARQTHRFSCALCKWAKKMDKVLRLSRKRNPRLAKALEYTINKAQMAIAVPVSQGRASLTVTFFRMTTSEELTERAENDQNNFLRLSSQKIMREVLAKLASEKTLST